MKQCVELTYVSKTCNKKQNTKPHRCHIYGSEDKNVNMSPDDTNVLEDRTKTVKSLSSLTVYRFYNIHLAKCSVSNQVN